MMIFSKQLLPLVFGMTVPLMYMACTANPETEGEAQEQNRTDVVEIIAKHMAFEAPDTIPSGWITFRLTNTSEMVHFAVLERMPEGKGIKEQQEVAPIFQNIMDNINGKPLSAPDAGLAIPEWFSQIVFTSGPGFTSPGKASETTVLVEPGTYLIECYVKTAGVFHSYNPSPDFYGMVHQFTVTEEPSGGSAPVATVHVEISSESGIEIMDSIETGPQTFAVHFADQKVYGNYAGHDVHLMQMSDTTDLSKVVEWMDWVKPKGLETPAPAVFLGGTHEMPAGKTGYFNVDLSPGRYALIAEVPGADTLNMLRTFSVSSSEVQ